MLPIRFTFSVAQMMVDPEGLSAEMKSHRSNWNLEQFIQFTMDKRGIYGHVRFYPYVAFTVGLDAGLFNPNHYVVQSL